MTADGKKYEFSWWTPLHAALLFYGFLLVPWSAYVLLQNHTGEVARVGNGYVEFTDGTTWNNLPPALLSTVKKGDKLSKKLGSFSYDISGKKIPTFGSLLWVSLRILPIGLCVGLLGTVVAKLKRRHQTS